MKMEHIAMYVHDLEGAKRFFCHYFCAQPNTLYHNQITGFQSYFLRFDNGTRLEIMTRPELHHSDMEPNRTGYIHLAFSTGSKEQVDTLTAQLKKDGYTILSGPRTTGDGYYESCVEGFEGNLIEITV